MELSNESMKEHELKQINYDGNLRIGFCLASVWFWRKEMDGGEASKS